MEGRSSRHKGQVEAVSDSLYIVSVVRDFAMYDRLVRNNPNNAGAEFLPFDNNAENKTIPVRYNSFLNSYDYSKEAWFVFCHEDFQFLEPLSGKLPTLDKGVIYGVFGAKLRVPGVGLQIDSNKDGSDMSFRGSPVSKPTTVDTIDCACLIVHSSLVAKYGLRFDENLTYDLYTEDFGIAAQERYGIATKVLPIRSHHYSYGNIQQRFHDQLGYLNDKYADASRVYVTTTAFAIGKAVALPRVNAILDTKDPKKRIPFRWLFYRKVSQKGKLVIRVLGIPVWGKIKYSMSEWHQILPQRKPFVL